MKKIILLLIVITIGGSVMLFAKNKEDWKTCERMWKDYTYKKYWEKYNRLSESLIMEVPKEKLYSLVDDYVFFNVGEYWDEKCDELLAKMPPLCRYVYYVYQLEGEVNNGGFDQYFFNAAGYDAPETLEALEAFGLTEIKKLLERALNLLYTKIDKADYKKLCGERELPTEEFEKELSELDDLFYKYPERIEDVINDYLDKHRKELITNKN